MVGVLAMALAALTLQLPADRALERFSYIDGLKYTFALTNQDVTDDPRWLPSQAAPPLSPRAAQVAAREMLQTLFPNGDVWRNRDIRLVQAMFPDAWHYQVIFDQPQPAGHQGAISTITVLVRMNGRAVTPTVSQCPTFPQPC